MKATFELRLMTPKMLSWLGKRYSLNPIPPQQTGNVAWSQASSVRRLLVTKAKDVRRASSN